MIVRVTASRSRVQANLFCRSQGAERAEGQICEGENPRPSRPGVQLPPDCLGVLLPVGTGPDDRNNVGERCDVRPDDVKPRVDGFGLA